MRLWRAAPGKPNNFLVTWDTFITINLLYSKVTKNEGYLSGFKKSLHKTLGISVHRNKKLLTARADTQPLGIQTLSGKMNLGLRGKKNQGNISQHSI